MEISCNVIRDLLPLYAEDMVSEDSQKLIEDHLMNCQACTAELESIKRPIPPVIVIKPDDVWARIRKNMLWIVLGCFVAAIMFCLFILIFLFLLLV